VYRSFQERIRSPLKSVAGTLVVELDSGIEPQGGIPECVTTDIFPNEWLDRQENAYALSFSNRSVSNLILFDVWHHLEYPGAALQEFSRALMNGGLLILFEPAMSILGIRLRVTSP
jgi:SAM-dependent methyltransferase